MSSFYHAQSGKMVYVGGGIPGRSAYEEAVAKGFVGTEAEWLASLKGERGADGVPGEPGAPGPRGEPGAPGPVTRALPLMPLTAPRAVRAGDILICQPSTWPAGTDVVRVYQWIRDGLPISWATSEQYERTVDDVGVTLSCEERVTVDGVTVALHSNALYFVAPSIIISPTIIPPAQITPPRIVSLGEGVWQVIMASWAGTPAPEVTGYFFLDAVERTAELDDDLIYRPQREDEGLLLWIEVATNIGGSATVRATALIEAVPAPVGWAVTVDGSDILVTSAPLPAAPAAPAAVVDGNDILISE